MLKITKNNFSPNRSFGATKTKGSLPCTSQPSWDNFDIVGIDISKDAVELANNGIHTLFPFYADSFIMLPEEEQTDKQKNLSALYHQIMEPCEKPEKPINTSNDFIGSEAEKHQQYYKVKDEVQKNFTFKIGDIRDIKSEETSPKVGAVFLEMHFIFCSIMMAQHQKIKRLQKA